MSWLSTIAVISQLIALVVKNWFERDAEERERKKGLHAEAKEAIRTGDKSAVTAIFDRLHK